MNWLQLDVAEHPCPSCVVLCYGEEEGESEWKTEWGKGRAEKIMFDSAQQPFTKSQREKDTQRE